MTMLITDATRPNFLPDSDAAIAPTAADAPTRVLLLGYGWDALQPALAAAGDAIILAGPEPAYDPDAHPGAAAPAVLLIAPDADIIPRMMRDGKPDDAHTAPAVLRCIADGCLDAPDCYDDLYDDADDFIVVPAAPSELLKRILRLARRRAVADTADGAVAGTAAADAEIIRVGAIALNPATYQVTANGQPVDLAWLEFRLLQFLMTNLGKVFTRDQLLASVWGVANIGGTRTVDVHIRRLRYKLETGGAAYFRTVKNVGYGMVAP